MSTARHTHNKFAKHGMLVVGGICLLLILSACGGGSGGSAINSDGNDVPQATAAAANTASPTPSPAAVAIDSDTTCGIPNFQAEITAAVNAARAQGAVCGAVTRQPSKPLAWHELLSIAAVIHSTDMALHDFFAHVSPSTGTLRERIHSTGFQYEEAGENLAGGQTTIAKVVADWIQSPSHCANMLNPEFKVMGAACKHSNSAFYKTYWTLEMALPLGEKPETEIETNDKTDAKTDVKKDDKKDDKKDGK